MDDRLKQELANWLEFYRELGIGDFYRRAARPGEPSLALHRQASTSDSARNGARAPASPRRRLRSRSGMAVCVAASSPPPAARASGTAGRRSADQAPVPSLSLFETPPPKPAGPETLEQIRADLGDCHRCKLAGGRKTIVFGETNPHAELVFIGEGPGADEDEQGRPFVGRAGKLLNRMIQMIGMKREEVYICNVVKCRPPGNRTPEKDEIETCSPFLFRQIEAIKPRLICCLGAPAVRTVLGIKEGITKIRGRFYDFGSYKALATVHPAYILRNPREEKILREDFEKIREFLGR